MASRSARGAWLVAALSVIALIGTFVWMRANRPATVEPDLIRFTIAPPENTSFGGPTIGGSGNNAQLAISPDGRNIVYVAGTPSRFQLWLRPVGSAEARLLPGTEGATFPFWSPDSQFVAFFTRDKLKKLSIGGGPVMVLTDLIGGLGLGGSWSRDNVIVFGGARAGLFRVPAAGGAAAAVTTLAQGEDAHRWPHFLPDGQHFLYNAVTSTCCPAATPGAIKIGSLDQAEPTVTLLEGDSSVTLVSGHLLFAREETLMAQAFDPDTRQLSGDAVPVLESVSREGSRYVSTSVSGNGTLVYAAGGSPNPSQLIWFNRSGAQLGTLGNGAGDIAPALSPDERQVAVALRTGTPPNLDVWTIDLARNLPSRVTTGPLPQGWPVWSPDGTRIVFGTGSRGQSSAGPEKPRLVQTQVNRTGADETVLEDATTPSRLCGPGQCGLLPSDWSPDGRFVLYTLGGSFPVTSDIWALPMIGERKPFPVIQTQFRESLGVFSPDGRWIAYMTDETGELNVYVQSFLHEGGKHRISPNGGRNPHWRGDGKELFYLDANGAMTAVPIDTTKTFDAGLPTTLFPTGVISMSQMYAVTKDGQRFLVNTRPPNAAAAVTPLNVIVNWTSTLQK